MPDSQEPTNPEIGYERSDANIKWVTIWLVVLLALVVVAMVMALGVFGSLANRRATIDPTPLPLSDIRPTPPPPRLQPNPIDQTTAEEELEQLRASEEEILNSYGWVDRENGVVRIPIERAIELLAEDSPSADEPDK